MRLAFVMSVSLLLAIGARAAHADDDTWVLSDAGVKATHDCGKQPKVVIDASRDTITLTGKCARVSVNGGSIAITAESIAELSLNGAINTVSVDELGKLAMTGAENKVVWKTALGGKRPRVSDLGSGNSVTQAP
jgi:hypothetical protein